MEAPTEENSVDSEVFRKRTADADEKQRQREHKKRQKRRNKELQFAYHADLLKKVFTSADLEKLSPASSASVYSTLSEKIADAPFTDWSALPNSLDPSLGGGLQEERRAQRKKWQVRLSLVLLSSSRGL